MGRLMSSTSYFSSHGTGFPSSTISYTQTEAFHASFQPLLRYGAPLEAFVPTTYPLYKGVTPLWDRGQLLFK